MAGQEEWKKVVEDFDTLVIRESCHPENFASSPLSTPIVNSVSYIMPGVDSIKLGGSKHYEYGRYANPTRDALENCLAKLEGSKYAVTFASGSAAINGLVETFKSRDHIVATRMIYGGSFGVLEKAPSWGIQIDFTNKEGAEDIAKLVKKGSTKMVYIESPSNPTLSILDIKAICDRIHGIDPTILVAIDNTFLTPVLQRPLELGVDVCVYSCTKYLGGHGDIIMGALTTSNEDLYRKIRYSQDGRGGIPSPFDCYLLLRSLKTLPIRMERHMKNGLAVAQFLEGHPKVERVIHPGLKSHPQHQLALKQQNGHSGMVGFYIKGGMKESVAFMEHIKLIKRAASLGSDVSLACVPARISHVFLPESERQTLGITDNYIRISVGLESPPELCKDIDQALIKAFA